VEQRKRSEHSYYQEGLGVGDLKNRIRERENIVAERTKRELLESDDLYVQHMANFMTRQSRLAFRLMKLIETRQRRKCDFWTQKTGWPETPGLDRAIAWLQTRIAIEFWNSFGHEMRAGEKRG
jgi:hypothetical protein